MTVHYRTFSPDTCDCSFELEIDEQGNSTVVFAHNFCPAHKPIAEAQTPLSQTDLSQRRNEIATKLEDALTENHTRNLADYDNNPTIKTRLTAARNMILNQATEQQGLMLEAQIQAEREFIDRGLNNHDSEARAKILNTIFGHDLAFNTDVFTVMVEENQRKNIALQVALDNGPTTLYDIKDGSRIKKETVNFTFTWSGTAPNRVLSISFNATITNAQKTTIRNALNARLGSGKVLLP